MALLSESRTTGLVLDCGAGVSHMIPIVESFCFAHCINSLGFAGQELNTLLAKLLSQDGTCLTTTADMQHVRLMKERHCYVAAHPSKECAQEVTYTLPDG